MLRLPLCPHCRTVYHYRDTVKIIKDKKAVCYHCQKSFKRKLFPGALILGMIIVILNILTNIFLLSQMKSLNLIILMIITLAYIMLFILLLPFFISFQKQDEKKNKTNKNSSKR